jgi:hypothetical protein
MGKIKCETKSTEITSPTCGKGWKRCGPCLTPILSICRGKIPPKMEIISFGKKKTLVILEGVGECWV